MIKFKLSILLILVLCSINYAHTQTNPPADFPEYNNTENPKADNANYDKAKKAWVESNPEAYKKMGGQIEEPPTPALDPEIDDVAYEPGKCDEDALPPIVPANCTIWELTNAHVLDKDNQLKTGELTQLQAEIREEYLSETIYWKMSSEGMLYIFYNDNYKGHFQMEKDNKQLTLLPYEETACSNGTKIFPFDKWDEEQFIINMPDQDEGSSLVYQLIFSPAR